MAMPAREPLGFWRFPVLLLFLSFLAAFAKRLDDDDGEEEEPLVAEEEANSNLCPFGTEAPARKVQQVMDPLPDNVTVDHNAIAPPGIFQNCPRVVVNPSQQMVVKTIQGGSENREEYTFLSLLTNKKVAISPSPFFFVDRPNTDRPNKHFVFMELIESENLMSIRRDNGAFDGNILELIVAQMLYQVLILHQFNIVHRDLKPDQWLLSPPACAQWVRDHDAEQFIKGLCRLVLTDYDFACTSGSPPFQCDLETLGSPYYMPREAKTKWNEEYRMKPSRDIWSLAVSIVDLGVNKWRPNSQNALQTVKDAESTLGPLLTRIMEQMFILEPKKRKQALGLFKMYVEGRMVDGKLPDMLGLTDGADSWAKRAHPEALAAAKKTLSKTLGSLGPANAYQLYAALVERHYYASKSPVPEWVKDYGGRLQTPFSAGVPLAAGGSPAARKTMSEIRQSFPLKTTVVSEVGGADNLNGVLPVVRITPGSYPVVIAGEATAVQIFADHASSGPLRYFFVERGSAQFSFLEDPADGPIKLEKPTKEKQWQVAKLIVAQILLQLTLLQENARMALQNLQPNHWRLRPLGCTDLYRNGDVSQFVKQWCQVVLVGFDGACAMEGAMRQHSSGIHPVNSIACPSDKDLRRTDVGSFGIAIVKIFAFGGANCSTEDCRDWRESLKWPELIRSTLDKSLLPIGERPFFDNLFQAYRENAKGSTLATMLELSAPAGQGTCLTCLMGTSKPKPNWLSKDVPKDIVAAASDALKHVSSGDEYSSMEALQLYAILVEKHYEAARRTLPSWTEDLRRRLNRPGSAKRHAVEV